MIRPHGYATVVDPDRPIVERDTITCGHCQQVIFTKPGTVSTVYLRWDVVRQTWTETEGAGCKVCMRAVCLRCYHVGTCQTWERAFEASEAKDRLRRQALGIYR